METTVQNPEINYLAGHKANLTKRFIQECLSKQLPPKQQQIEISDTQCRSLKLIIYASGKAVFYSRFRWKYTRHTQYLGEFNEINLETARIDASAHRLSVTTGKAFIPIKYKKITFSEAFQEYLKFSTETKPDFKSDVSKYKNHILPHFGDKIKLADISSTEINQYLRMVDSKSSSHNQHLGLLQAAEKFFIGKGWIVSPFAREAKYQNKDNGRVRYLSKVELGRFLDACNTFEGDSFRCFEFLATLGLRISEGLGVRLENWDREAGTYFLHKSKTGPRHITLNSAATAVLTQQAEKYGTQGFAFRGKHPDRMMSRPSKSWKKLIIKAGLDDGTVTPHTLRHTFCSHLLMAGVDEFTVARLMGLKSTKCIHEHYGHISRDALHEACEIAAEIYNQSKGGKYVH